MKIGRPPCAPTRWPLSAGPAVVLRIMLGLVIFHALMAVLLIGVKSSHDKRAGIQNG